MDYKALAAELETYHMRMHHKKSKQKLSNLTHGGEMLTLRLIVSFKTPVSPGELSLGCGVSTARIATTLKSLENKGYILRETDREDRRRTCVTATDLGRRISESFEAKRAAGLERMLRELGERDAAEYVRLTGRVSEIMSDMCF